MIIKDLLTGDKTVRKLKPKENLEELSEDEEEVKRKRDAALLANAKKKKVVNFFK